MNPRLPSRSVANPRGNPDDHPAQKPAADGQFSGLWPLGFTRPKMTCLSIIFQKIQKTKKAVCGHYPLKRWAIYLDLHSPLNFDI